MVPLTAIHGTLLHKPWAMLFLNAAIDSFNLPSSSALPEKYTSMQYYLFVSLKVSNHHRVNVLLLLGSSSEFFALIFGLFSFDSFLPFVLAFHFAKHCCIGRYDVGTFEVNRYEGSTTWIPHVCVCVIQFPLYLVRLSEGKPPTVPSIASSSGDLFANDA